jgi:hypothetical protein
VTADEVADPHVWDDKDGTAGAHGRITAKTSPRAQPAGARLWKAIGMRAV